jgi:hypothetical protein
VKNVRLIFEVILYMQKCMYAFMQSSLNMSNPNENLNGLTFIHTILQYQISRKSFEQFLVISYIQMDRLSIC